MNRSVIARVIGLILCIEALCMVPSFAIALFTHGADSHAFAVSIALCGGVGGLLTRIKSKSKRFQTRDGFVAVALCWIVMGLTGALPYALSGYSYVDAVFETVSGFTTTGATIVSAPSALPQGLQFWRALTQWMGGMGVLVMVLALMPSLGEGSVNLMKAESPGPISSKLRPKTSETAKSLYIIYIALTAAETLMLRVAGMPLFDSLTTAFTTISTGGFSVRDESIAYYHSEPIVWIIIVFMFVSGINFGVLFQAQRRAWKDALRSEELRWYTVITVGAVALIAVDLVLKTGLGVYQGVSQSAFQVVTLMTTTGYATADFDLWPYFSKLILVLVMFIGGCAGSTAGGVKVSRLVILFKGLKRELRRILHTREVRPLTLEGERVAEGTVSSVSVFFFAYIVILLVCAAVVSLDEVDFTTAFTAALTTISNVGPGFVLVGPTCNFGFLSSLSKIVLTITMLLGRLEIMPLLVLLFPSVWKK
ncbi:MAG: TrkH family potassium uptake protein [Oscillospiraceae bacterium]|nr:TrkH family potassium uptake protein [Oscillospiraceae bacterium]